MTGSAPTPSPTRRQVLAGALLLPAAACIAAGMAACADSSASDGGSAPADPALRSQASADEQRLLAAYAATAARHPDLAGVLAVPWQQHREHAARLAGTSGAAGTAPPTAPPVPGSSAAAVRALAALERSVAASRRAACATAGRQLAPLLGSLAAAELVHADVLLAGGGT